MSCAFDERRLYELILVGFVLSNALAFVALLFVRAPYGRHFRGGWGPAVDATLGWMVMESPAALVFAACWLSAAPERRSSATGLAFLALWELHYVNRAFVFPFRRRGGQRRMPLAIVLLSVAFNVVNAYLNARWLFTLGPERPAGWMADPRFVLGATLFVSGAWINRRSDRILFALRRSGAALGEAYAIPRGALFRYVSCPNYLGEIVEWTGWALATFSPAGCAFALATASNLVPRAFAHHRWYRERFVDYPAERKAILPFLL